MDMDIYFDRDFEEWLACQLAKELADAADHHRDFDYKEKLDLLLGVGRRLNRADEAERRPRIRKYNDWPWRRADALGGGRP